MMLALMSAGGLSGLAGCRETPPPPRVPVPVYEPSQRRDTVSREVEKPLPPPRYANPDAYPPFDDVPLVSQQAPETPAFLDAYRRVGSPRIVVFVNRNFDSTQTGTAKPDELRAKTLDYEAIENIMTDWLACGGQVTIISPVMARQKAGRSDLTFEQVQQLGADILVRVTAHPTKQTPDGPEVRMVAEALNVKGGQSISRAVVDVPPPLEKTTINTYTRFMARKLMDGMIGSWLTPAAPADRAAPSDRAPSDRTAPSDRVPLPPPAPLGETPQPNTQP
jgi:hypothetical protein